MKKFFKYLLLTIVTLIFVVVLTTSSILFWIIRNPQSAWTMAQEKFLPRDLIVSWTDMDFRLDHLSGWNYKLDWTIEGLKVTKESPEIILPIQHVRVHASIFPLSDNHKIVLHHLVLQANSPLTLSVPPSDKIETEKNPFQQFHEILSLTQKIHGRIRWEILDVKVPELKLSIGDSKPMVFNAGLQQSTIQDTPSLSYTLEMTLPEQIKLIANGNILQSTASAAQLEMNANIDFSGFSAHVKQKLKLTAGDNQTNISSEGPAEYINKNLKLSGRPQLALTMNPKSLQVKLKTAVNGILGPYVRLPATEVNITIPLESDRAWSEQPSTFMVNVPAQLIISDPQLKASISKSCECQPPEHFQMGASGNIWLHTVIPSDQSADKTFPLLDADVKINDVVNKLLTVKLAGHLKVEKQNANYKFLPSLNLALRVDSFQALARLLDGLGVMVPSPLDILEGTVEAKMNGPVDVTEKGYFFPLAATLKLNSTQQTVDASAEARVILANDLKSTSIDTQVSINQLQLELPPLKPTKGNPRILKDPRILSQPTAQKKPNEFKLEISISVKTTSPGAIRLLAEYFKPHIPISISFQSTDLSDNSGFIRLEPFDIVYLRREVHVSKMNIDLAKSDDNGLYVDGQLRIKQSQYTVFIDILGPANKPNIVFSSNPDLPRSEIINVLLYDRTSDQMLSTDVETSGQVEAAVADKAIGLFGIWAFASTPIRGFSYNPSTKVYTATVELADDVTASVGTKWESSTQVELRKRVSRRWMLTAAWTPADEGAPSSKLVLQWERRF